MPHIMINTHLLNLVTQILNAQVQSQSTCQSIASHGRSEVHRLRKHATEALMLQSDGCWDEEDAEDQLNKMLKPFMIEL